MFLFYFLHFTHPTTFIIHNFANLSTSPPLPYSVSASLPTLCEREESILNWPALLTGSQLFSAFLRPARLVPSFQIPSGSNRSTDEAQQCKMLWCVNKRLHSLSFVCLSVVCGVFFYSFLGFGIQMYLQYSLIGCSRLEML